jgi:hypothetical protein
MEILEQVRALATKLEPVGSRVTCNPPPTDTDEDWLVLVAQENQLKMFELMNAEPSKYGLISDFQSYRVGNLNFIVTYNEIFFRKFMAATSVAKKLNLLDKQDRVDLFKAVIYGDQHEI